MYHSFIFLQHVKYRRHPSSRFISWKSDWNQMAVFFRRDARRTARDVCAIWMPCTPPRPGANQATPSVRRYPGVSVRPHRWTGGGLRGSGQCLVNLTRSHQFSSINIQHQYHHAYRVVQRRGNVGPTSATLVQHYPCVGCKHHLCGSRGTAIVYCECCVFFTSGEYRNNLLKYFTLSLFYHLYSDYPPFVPRVYKLCADFVK